MSYTELMVTIPDLIEQSDSIKVVEVARKYDQVSRLPVDGEEIQIGVEARENSACE